MSSYSESTAPTIQQPSSSEASKRVIHCQKPDLNSLLQLALPRIQDGFGLFAGRQLYITGEHLAFVPVTATHIMCSLW